jgi:alpha-beta hydrolase superfamily lysophospholipase
MALKSLLLCSALCAAAAPAAAETYLLVHGAFQTAAGWETTAAALRAAGDTAVTVNLPGRAGDGRAPGTVQFADHVAAVSQAVADAAAADPDGRVTLVGHSFGGLVISAVAEADPAPLAGLVYVAAYLPQVGTVPGDSLQTLAMSDHHGGWQADSFVVAADYSTASVLPRDRAALFANDADPALAEQIAAAMVDEPLAPLATPVPLTAAAFGTVRAGYVVTLRDRAVSTDFQLTMIGRGMVAEAVPLDTGHAPQLTAPDALATAIRRAASPELE